MTLKPSYLSFSAAKRLALFSPLLCLLLLTACAPQQSGLQHHQYSIVRYQDSLTALHDYRPPTREALSYTARRELQTAGAAVSQNGSNVRFTPIPDEEFDDGDIEVTPELLKEPSLYPALSAHPAHQGNYPGHVVLRPPQASRQTQGGSCTRAWISPETAGKKSLLPRPAKSCTAAAKVPMA